MNSTLTHHTFVAPELDQNPSSFRGFITKLLHEAFYLEDGLTSQNSPLEEHDFFVSEPEESCDQLSFIHQFLKLRT
jgi:hypothetical protein